MKPIPENWSVPYLCLENDNTYYHQCLTKISRPAARSNVRQENPWNTLHENATFTYERRYGRNKEPSAHPNALDYKLNATYNHSTQWLLDKEQVLIQPASENLKSGVRDCRPVVPVKLRPGTFGHPVYISPVQEKSMNINSIGMAIEGPHISQTKNGYSRKKESGTFYRC